MIVDRRRAYLICTGAITQHRIPVSQKVSYRSLTLTGDDAETGTSGPTRATPKLGQLLNINTPSGIACTVEVTSSRRDRHRDTLDDDAFKALGGDRPAWARFWLLEHDAAWLSRRLPRDVESISTINDAEAALAVLPDDAVLRRFERRWADKPVWAVEWEVLNDLPRLLVGLQPHEQYRTLPSGRQEVVDDGDEAELLNHGYTTRLDLALPHEPEAVDADELNPGWARDAARRHAEAQDRRATARRLARDLRAS